MIYNTMSLYKKIFGYSLILFSFVFIILIGMPQLYQGNSAGKIDKEAQLHLDFLEKEDSKLVLLYFGYVGCETICTPSMSEINEIYTKVKNENIAVYFVNLLSSQEKDMPDIFAKHFNKNFHGIYLDTLGLEKLSTQMRIAYTKSPSNEFDINHAGHLYLLLKNEKNYLQKYIYTTRPFNIKTIIEDIQHLLK